MQLASLELQLGRDMTTTLRGCFWPKEPGSALPPDNNPRFVTPRAGHQNRELQDWEKAGCAGCGSPEGGAVLTYGALRLYWSKFVFLGAR